jgi:rhamnogalacturonan endolyase
MSGFFALFLFALALLPHFLLAKAPGGGGSGPDVTLQDAGASVVLSNGLLTATIAKDKATVTSIKFMGREMVASVYYSMDGGKDFRVPSHCVYAVHAATPDMVDVQMTSLWQKEAQAFDIEVHYVLRRGAAGLYSYAVLTHPASYPDTGHGEWRMVWKLPEDLLEKICVDDLRHWQMPSSDDLKHAEKTPIKEIVKLTTGVMAGQYDCKYKYSAEYWDLGCWGHASDKNKVGGWIVLGSHEYFNDGPTKQDLNASSGINHLYFGMNHYGASTVKVAKGESWQKIYGPSLIYCNSNPAGGDACWSDAKEQAKTEQAAWPYAWLKHPAYPTAQERGTVSGQLVVKDELKPQLNGANAWVGLANPSAGGNWQFESKNYQFWVKTDANGKFTIPNVRPGTYTLYAFTRGAVGECGRHFRTDE